MNSEVFPPTPYHNKNFLSSMEDSSATDEGPSLTYHGYMSRHQTALRSSSMTIPPPYYFSEVEENPRFQRLIITPTGKEIDTETVEISQLLLQAMKLRTDYVYKETKKWKSNEKPSPTATFSPFDAEIPPVSQNLFQERDGVYYFFENEKAKEDWKPLVDIPSINQYYKDLEKLSKIFSFGPAKTLCFKRLRLLESKFNLHILLNEGAENAATKLVPHRDFYNVRKVDTHIHHSSSMNQKHLLKFIKRKLRECANEEVIIRDGAVLTLKQVFESLNFKESFQLSVDTLDVHADPNVFYRFDKFNLKYNPCGQSRLREIFLKTDNYIKGRYLAELTKELFHDLEVSKYQYAEYRVSIYGRSKHEWERLANWIYDNKLFSESVRWLIQIPRLYSEFKQNKMIENMGQLIDNIFAPLYEVTANPSSNPKLHMFLQQVVGFDCVDDESKLDKKFMRKFPPPRQWDTPYNPPYTYYCFYIWANLKNLNFLREQKDMNIFNFRPHSGEAGDVDHLECAYILANGISHGINLRKAPVLQYLYYLNQIGIAMSPLSNNSLFLDYQKNPFPIFFARGLNVSLSTDDPLQFHYTKEPLIEEYSIAAQVWKLTPTDLCEIARNSVLQSGFEHPVKMHWLGAKYDKPDGNDIRKTNIPNIRICFRNETLVQEFKFLVECLSKTPNIDISLITDYLQLLSPATSECPLN